MRIGDEVYIHGYVDEIRQNTIIIHNDGGYFGTTPNEIMRVDAVQSIDIESKQGEWIVDEGGWKGLDYYPPKCKCNQCGYEEELYIIHAKPTNFCPNCGARMKGASND